METTAVARAAGRRWTRSPLRTSRLPAALAGAALIALALLAAGCGGRSSNVVAHVGSNTTTQSAAPASGGGRAASAASADTTALTKYAQCMRAHGLPSFPDPVNGHLSLKITKGGPLDPTTPQYTAAQQACKSLAPAGMVGSGQPSTQQQNQAIQFATCMRTNGAPNFPDPNKNGGFLITGATVDPNSSAFRHAIQACRSLLPAGATPATP